MTAPAPEFDLNDATPVDLNSDDFGQIPDHTASREERRSFWDYLKGGKKLDSEDERPRSRARKTAPRKPKRRAPTAKKGAFVEPLMQMYGFAGAALFTVDQHCGSIVLENAEKCAQAMDELAYQNESVRRVLDSLTTTSAVGQVLMAHAPIILAVASHHGGGKIPFIPAMPTEETQAA